MKFGQDDKKKGKGKGGRSPSFGGGPSLATVLELQAQVEALAANAGGAAGGGFATSTDVAAAIAAREAAQAAADQAQDAAAQAANAAQDAAAAAEEMNDTAQEAATDAEQATQDSDIADNSADIAALSQSITALSQSITNGQVAQDARIDALEALPADDDTALEARVAAIEAIGAMTYDDTQVQADLLAIQTALAAIPIDDDSDLETRVAAIEAIGAMTYDDTQVQADIDALEAAVAAIPADDDTALDARVAAIEAIGAMTYDDTQVRADITALQAAIAAIPTDDDTANTAAIAALQAAVAAIPTDDDSTLVARLDALEAAPDNDTIYDDTQIQADIAALQVDSHDGAEQDAQISSVLSFAQSISSRVDSNDTDIGQLQSVLGVLDPAIDLTALPDHVLNQLIALQAVSHDGAAQDARLDALEAAPDNDTIYDDTQVTNDIATLELSVDGLEVDITDVNDRVVANTADIAAINAQLPDDDSPLAQAIADNAAALATEISDTDADVNALTASIAANATLAATNAAAASTNSADIATLQATSHDGAAQDTRLDALEAINPVLLDTNQVVDGFKSFTERTTFLDGVSIAEGTSVVRIMPNANGAIYDLVLPENAPLPGQIISADPTVGPLGGQVSWVYPYGFEFQEAPFVDEFIATDSAAPGQVATTVSTVATPVGGRYEVNITGQWSHDNTGNDAFLTMVSDDGTILATIRAEPKDSQGAGGGGTDQRQSFVLRRLVDVDPGVQRSYTLNVRPSVNGVLTGVHDVEATIIRVSN